MATPRPDASDQRPADEQPTAWKRFLHRRGLTRGDIAITVGGLCLAAACAAFPWYVFLNQEQFGVREMRFSGNMTPGGSATSDGMSLAGTLEPQDFPVMELDLFATGTTAPDEERAAPAHQPFPEGLGAFKLVHVANGRAMIEDEGGLFVVQTGSILPDASTVTSIEQRSGKWVLVTSTGRALEVE